jgi:hypothetical protein
MLVTLAIEVNNLCACSLTVLEGGFMNKWKNLVHYRGGPTEPRTRMVMRFLMGKGCDMNKYIVASVFGLGLGAFFSSQALAADTTPPVVSATVVGTQGTNGWYTSNVSVTWSVADAESTIVKKAGCLNTTLKVDVLTKTYACVATSQGGTTRKTVVVKRDTKPPKVAIVTPVSGAKYAQNKIIKASYSCTDLISKIGTCVGTVARGANIDTATPGSKTFSVIATDKAGNTANS